MLRRGRGDGAAAHRPTLREDYGREEQGRKRDERFHFN
jgi:hypothetical protein